MACALSLPAIAAPGSPARASATVGSKVASSTAVNGKAAEARPRTGTLTGPAPTPAQRARQALWDSEHAASVEAVATRKPVVVSSETNTGTLVTANPNGSFTLTETSEPVRVRQDGTWVPINPDLVRGTDGSWHTVATTSDVAFSDGGSGAMATLASGGDSLSFTFPGALPKPAVSGPVATYRSVLPGVDLQLTANASGFSELLIVRDKAAAANPALRSLQLGMSTHGVTVSGTPDGGAQATTASGAAVFRTDTAAMWDSAPSGPAGTAKMSTAAAATGGTTSTGMGHMARVGVRVSHDSETLVPDASLLSSASTVYPVYIDPAWSGNPSQLHWARISSNGWNIYDSTSTASSDHPRSGYDDWPGGADEVARTFYQMNTTGIAYDHVASASLYVTDTFSADSSPTSMNLYDSGEPVDNGWNSTDLTWSNQPAADTLQDGSETSYETSSGTVSPGTIGFNIANGAAASASNAGGALTLVLESGSETNGDYWKQYASGGGATISVTYYVTPDLVGGTGNPTLGPAVTGAEPGYTDSPTVTLTISCEANSTVQKNVEDVENFYQVWNYSGGKETTQVGSDLYSPTFSVHGSSVTTGTLSDGTYAWHARCKNQGPGPTPDSDSADNLGSYQYWDTNGWSQYQVFTVDTKNPATPTVSSPQFPSGMEGDQGTTDGTFTFNSNNSSDGVMGYLFSLDGDLGSTVFGSSDQVTEANGSTLSPITPGTVYYVPASSVPNGLSDVTFAPGAIGPHRVYVKAVDQAGNTSTGEATYLFWAGPTSPTYVAASQLVAGGSIDGMNVPAGVYANTGGGTGALTTESDCCGVNWYGGAQAWLSNGSGAVASGDSATLSFPVPTSGAWDLGVDLTKAPNYGTYNITLNQNKTTNTPAVTLLSKFDAYNAQTVTQYEDLGVPQSGGSALTLPAGVYSITFTLTGEDPASTGYQLGLDLLRLAPMTAQCTITSMTNCYNNTAISPNTDISSGNADGEGDSFAADQLNAAGWTHGATISVNGAPITLPSFGDGAADNMVASGQKIAIPSTWPANTGNAIEFLAFSTNGTVNNASGTFTYASPCFGNSTQGYTLSTVPDWMSGPASAAAITFPGRNQPGEPDDDASQPRIYAISVPLACATDPVASITLPAIADGVQYNGSPTLHILAFGLRSSSYTGDTYSQNWTATFAAREDSTDGGLTQATVRMPAVVSVGGTSLRIHLSNALGTAPVTFNHVTVAEQQTAATPYANTMTNVTFGGSATVTIPAGGDVTSDAVSFTTTQQEPLLVSVYTSAAIPDPVGHADGGATTWMTSSTNTTDEAGDLTGSPFTATSDGFLYWLTGIDVTSLNNTNGAVAFYGDQTINSDTSSGAPNRFTDDVTADLANANGTTVPYGILDLGENSSTSTNNLIPSGLSTSPTQESAADPVDRDLLDRANLRTVLISTGTSDIAAGESAATIEGKLQALASEIKGYYTDDNSNQSITFNNPEGQITVYVATIPPSSQFTTAEEQVREAVNASICGTGGPGGTCDTSGTNGADLNGASNGFVDFAGAVSAAGTDLSSTVAPANLSGTSPDNAYYAAEASAFTTATTSGTLPVQPDVVRG